MFRLIKLALYATLGWMLYELFQGMKHANSSGTQSTPSRSLRRALNEDAGRMNITGGGDATSVDTAEPDGGSMRRTVGRGVVTH